MMEVSAYKTGDVCTVLTIGGQFKGKVQGVGPADVALAHTMAQAVAMRRFITDTLSSCAFGLDTSHHLRAKDILAACEPPKKMTAVEKLASAVKRSTSEPWTPDTQASLAKALAEYEKEKGE